MGPFVQGCADSSVPRCTEGRVTEALLRSPHVSQLLGSGLPLRSWPILLRASRMSETDFRAHAIRCDNHRHDSIPVISEECPDARAEALQNISAHPPAPICSLFCLCQRCQSVLCDVLVNSLCVCSVCPGAGTQAAQLPHCMHASIT